jgi:hypothetical protein
LFKRIFKNLITGEGGFCFYNAQYVSNDGGRGKCESSNIIENCSKIKTNRQYRSNQRYCDDGVDIFKISGVKFLMNCEWNGRDCSDVYTPEECFYYSKSQIICEGKEAQERECVWIGGLNGDKNNACVHVKNLTQCDQLHPDICEGDLSKLSVEIVISDSPCYYNKSTGICLSIGSIPICGCFATTV